MHISVFTWAVHQGVHRRSSAGWDSPREAGWRGWPQYQRPESDQQWPGRSHLSLHSGHTQTSDIVPGWDSTTARPWGHHCLTLRSPPPDPEVTTTWPWGHHCLTLRSYWEVHMWLLINITNSPPKYLKHTLLLIKLISVITNLGCIDV